MRALLLDWLEQLAFTILPECVVTSLISIPALLYCPVRVAIDAMIDAWM